ncbi:Uncharacterised protein [Pannonibacter phragmitetus]|uniref:Lipoprotein n=1 Tax=Pannonibacter phragmitetus TaxID=121719 RepID=A0A378ZY40_9HYPH|nr:hypothetical protein [Pannonibacter phragmitetus]SUB02144.1 Uncharacterised protein [Pannonibacter phragmitetus]
MRNQKTGFAIALLALSACNGTSGKMSASQPAMTARTNVYLEALAEKCGQLDLAQAQAATFGGSWPARGTIVPPLFHGDRDTDLANTINWVVWRGFRPNSDLGFLSELVRSDGAVFSCQARPTLGLRPQTILAGIMRMFPPVAVASSSGRTNNGDVRHHSFLLYSGQAPAVIEITGTDSSLPMSGVRMWMEVPPNSDGKGAAQVLREIAAAMPPEEHAAVKALARDLQQRMRAALARDLASEAAESRRLKAELRARVEAGRQARGTTTGQMIGLGIAQGASGFLRQEAGFEETRRRLNGPSPATGSRTGGNGPGNGITLCATGYIRPPERYRNSIPPVEWRCDSPTRSEAEAIMAQRVAARDKAAKPQSSTPASPPVRERPRTNPCANAKPGVACTTPK